MFLMACRMAQTLIRSHFNWRGRGYIHIYIYIVYIYIYYIDIHIYIYIFLLCLRDDLPRVINVNSLMNSLPHWLTDSSTHSTIYPLTHPPTHSLTHSTTHSLTDHSLTQVADLAALPLTQRGRSQVADLDQHWRGFTFDDWPAPANHPTSQQLANHPTSSQPTTQPASSQPTIQPASSRQCQPAIQPCQPAINQQSNQHANQKSTRIQQVREWGPTRGPTRGTQNLPRGGVHPHLLSGPFPWPRPGYKWEQLEWPRTINDEACVVIRVKTITYAPFNSFCINPKRPHPGQPVCIYIYIYIYIYIHICILYAYTNT